MGKLWNQIQAESWALNEKNDCGVKATAIATGMEYGIVHGAYVEAGRKPRKGVTLTMMRKVIKQLGFEINTIVSYEFDNYNYKMKRSTDYYGKTAKTLKNLDMDKKYLVQVSRHVLAVVNNVVEDWTKNRKHHIQQIWEIVPPKIEHEVVLVSKTYGDYLYLYVDGEKVRSMECTRDIHYTDQYQAWYAATRMGGWT